VEFTNSTSVAWIPCLRVHVGVLIEVTCNRLFESSVYIKNLSIECYVNSILRHIVKEISEEETLLQTSRSYSSHLWSVGASTDVTKPSGSQGTAMNQWHQPFPHLHLWHSYCLVSLKDSLYQDFESQFEGFPEIFLNTS